jgi:hypothetical protein
LSAILDALRKVERETPPWAQQPSALPDSSLARLLAEKRNRKVFRRLVVVITILFLAGTGVTITLGNRLFSSKDNVSRPKVAEVSIKDRETKSSSVPVRQREEAPKPTMVAKKPDPEPDRQIKKEEPLPLPPRTETALPVPDKALQKSEPEPKKLTRKQERITLPPRTETTLPVAAKASEKPEPGPERLTKKEEPITLPPRIETALAVQDKGLQKPSSQIPVRPSSPTEPRRNETIIRDLELQAIVWSEDPGSRSAMINGRFVRLGEEVGGFTVHEIGQNQVYLKSGLRSGKLRMLGAR